MAEIPRQIFLSLALHSILCLFVSGNVAPSEERLMSVTPEEEYKLKADEMWPEEVAHLFDNVQEGQPKKETPSKNKRRMRRWTEWVSEKLEFRDDSWDEPSAPVLRKNRLLKAKPKFIAYEKNGTWVMSRCSSPKGAVTLVIACPQPRGSKFHRIVNLQTAFYGWSQHPGEVCQYTEGDCTKRYEFLHKQIMRPTNPQNEEEWQSLGPQFFCNPWESGDGREKWTFPTKRWCSVGLKRASQVPDVTDPMVNWWGQKYLYTWGRCGGSYDWFDYLHIQYTCKDVDEPINPDATRLYHYRPKPTCPPKSTTKPTGTKTTPANSTGTKTTPAN